MENINKLLVVALLITINSTIISSDYSSEIKNIIEFEQLEKKQKASWFDFMQECDTAKIALLKKQHDTMFDNKIEALKNFQANTEKLDDKAYVESMLKDKLKSVVNRHMVNAEAWSALGAELANKAKSLAAKQKAEVDAFVNKSGVNSIALKGIPAKS